MSLNISSGTDRIIRATEVVNMTGRSRVSIWRDEQAGLFPKRVKIGARAVGWRLSEINAWIESLGSEEGK